MQPIVVFPSIDVGNPVYSRLLSANSALVAKSQLPNFKNNLGVSLIHIIK